MVETECTLRGSNALPEHCRDTHSVVSSILLSRPAVISRRASSSSLVANNKQQPSPALTPSPVLTDPALPWTHLFFPSRPPSSASPPPSLSPRLLPLAPVLGRARTRGRIARTPPSRPLRPGSGVVGSVLSARGESRAPCRRGNEEGCAKTLDELTNVCTTSRRDKLLSSTPTKPSQAQEWLNFRFAPSPSVVTLLTALGAGHAGDSS